MEDILFSVNLVIPLFILVLLGYAMTNLKIWDMDFIQKATGICFKVFFPVLIFYNIYQSDFHKTFDISLIGYAVGSILLLFGIAMVLVPLFIKKNERKGPMIQVIVRSNVLLIYPIAESLYGAQGTGLSALISAFIIPLFNILVTIGFAVYDKENSTSFKSVLFNILKNPYVIGSLAGLAFAIPGIKMPYIFEKAASSISAIATPLALVLLGGTLKFKSLFKNKLALTVGTLARVLIVPIVFLGIAALLGFRGVELIALMCIYAAPVPSTSFILAAKANADSELSAQLVVTTTLAACFSFFLILYLGRTLGLLV